MPPPPQPLDPSLYQRVKEEANRRFAAPSSWYRSAWIVQTYKRLGGRYATPRSSRSRSQGLQRWLRERWVNLNAPVYDRQGHVRGYEPCGRSSVPKKSSRKASSSSSSSSSSRKASSSSSSSSSSSVYPLCRPLKRISRHTPRTLRELSRSRIRQVNRSKQKLRSRGRVRF